MSFWSLSIDRVFFLLILGLIYLLICTSDNLLDARHHKFYLFWCWIYIYFLNLFIYLLMAVLGLRFCARAFSSCGERGPLFIAVRGPLTVAASPVAEHRLQTRRLSSCDARA